MTTNLKISRGMITADVIVTAYASGYADVYIVYHIDTDEDSRFLPPNAQTGHKLGGENLYNTWGTYSEETDKRSNAESHTVFNTDLRQLHLDVVEYLHGVYENLVELDISFQKQEYINRSMPRILGVWQDYITENAPISWEELKDNLGEMEESDE